MYSNWNDFRMNAAAGGDEDESAEHMPLGDSITSLATVTPDMTQSFVDAPTLPMDTYGSESLPSSSQPPSHTTETTTSGTSLEQDMEGFSSLYNNPSRVGAGPSRGDFSGLGSWDHHQNLAPTSGGILSERPGDETPPQPHAAQPRSARGSVPIVPRFASFHTHRRTMCPRRLQEAMQSIINAYNAHSTEQQCSPSQATQAKQGLSLVQDFFDRYYPGQQPPSIASSAKVDNYGCYTCGTKSNNRGTLKRHVSDKHYPQFEYFCPWPGCPVTQHRRDKIRSHMRAHEGLHGESYIKRELPCPAKCMICTLNTNNWNEFYQCFLEHCKLGGSASQGVTSRRNSADHGQGSPSHNGSGVPAQAVQNRLLSVPGGAPGGNSSPSTWSDSQPYHPPPAGMVRSRLENQTAKAREDSNPVPRSHHTINKGKGTKRGKLSNPKHPRPPVSRGSSSQGTGSSGNAQEPKCTNCGHKFHECDATPFYGCHEIQSSKPNCHNCPGRQSIQSNVARPMATHQFPQSQPLPETNTYPWETVHLAELEQTHRSFPSGPDMPFFPSGQQDSNFLPGHWMNIQRDDLDDLSNVNSLDDLNDLPMWVVRDIDLPTLSEGELCSPLSVGSISPPPLTTLFSALSLKVPTGPPNKPLKDLPAIPSVWPYGGIEVFPWKEIPPPVTSLKCNCACNTMPTISATKKTADLPRGRRIEMSFSIAPNGPGSTLRNKVQIVVKLLSLRGTTKKKAEAREAVEKAIEKAIEPTLGRAESINAVEDDETEDEDCSDVDSLFSHSSDISSSTDMSLYEDQTLVPSHSYSGVEFTFDFELESSLQRISQWTGVLSPDFVDWDSCGSEFVDVDRIVEFFFKYILYVVVVLGWSADHAFGSRLGD